MFKKVLVGALVFAAAWVLVAALPDIARGWRACREDEEDDTDALAAEAPASRPA